MASTNSIQSTASSVCHPFGALPFNSIEPEKISSSIPDFPNVDPGLLLGRHCHFADMQAFPLEGRRFYNALVTGVSLGCESLGSSSHLLLMLDGSDYQEFVPVSELHLVSIE
ncbi:hypothetical protein [Pseudomonas savastanoi]|uniref:Uncharacterized protein n=1 Tax=Pseudomonas savastanoi TaxID=29438 RepID=A0A3M5ZQU6_PSESS|nr:hypothetical protein [Pseudomonas savastanoi]KPX07183.1 Unknown protein sequence [Pseudomonas syringae pv. cunninghamiae]RMV08834.1 hypothetical protein ALP16_01740 [Pseudomonas savastanoi]RMV19863.1 hypothetical protein ALP15_02465 [Pseudomonas savastanoi]